MPKFTILGSVPAERIPAIVPPEYRDRVRLAAHPGKEYTVVLFGRDREDVVTSGPVRRALAKIPAAENVLAIGAGFTVEAVELLARRHAGIVRLGEFHWTDESYKSLPR